jgi:prepilin-type N-terminal cleavage/methylation domain-containing protein
MRKVIEMVFTMSCFVKESSRETQKRRKMMNRNSKAGFTLVELMVVAIIVAILAAVSIPLMSANKKKAIATEGQAGCSSIRTALRVMQAEGATTPSAISGIKGLNTADLEGTYFAGGDYVYTPGSGTNFDNYVITATPSKNAGAGLGDVIMTNANGEASWGGSLLD